MLSEQQDHQAQLGSLYIVIDKEPGRLKKSGVGQNLYLFKSILGPNITPREGSSQQTPGFGVQIPDFTGLDQFHIPKMSDIKSMFLVQNTNSYIFQE
jgi:hypothetical protein